MTPYIIIIYRYEVSLTGEPKLNVKKENGKMSFTAAQLNEETFYRFLVSYYTGSSDMCPGPVISLPVMTKQCTGICYLFYTMISHRRTICTHCILIAAHADSTLVECKYILWQYFMKYNTIYFA